MAIAVGQRAVQEFLVDDRTIELFGEASTDRNPLHFDDEFGRATPFGGRIAHGMITAAFISALIGNELPGHGSVYVHVGKGHSTTTSKYWGLTAPVFDNPTSDALAIGDGGYLFDPRGDLRAWMLYPCVVACAP